MAAEETRMLLLGAVALFEPVNGYQIRRELLSWQVDRWAHTNPGSIYHGLASLTARGHLVRHDLRDAGREVAVYELTDAGRDELRRLMVDALEAVDPFERSAFTAAFSLLPLLDRSQVLRSLTTRRVRLEETVREFSEVDPDAAPPHATRGLVLWLDLAVAELAWLRETIDDVRSGSLAFEPGDDLGGWVPPSDDPGWQMNADREKYRAILGR
jgi:DNA-binding PadR family transcriptional regulator